MSEDRPSLAARVLAQGSRVDGRVLGGDGGIVETAGARLSAAGVRPGHVVLLTGLAAADLAGGMLAAWRLDAVPLIAPHDRNLPAELTGVCHLRGALEVTPAAGHATVPGLERTAVLMPTSGSTGAPRLARRGVASVLAEAAGYQDYLALTPADRVAVPVPMTHSYGWGVAMSTLLTGCDLYSTPPNQARALARLMDTGAVSVVALTAGIARLLVEVRRSGAQSVRATLVGAGRVPEELAEAFTARFRRPPQRGYGSTETGGTFLGTSGIGRPVAGVRVLRPAPGAEGELVIKLPAPVEGVLGAEPTEVWHTGDLVRCDADGVYHHLDRLRPGLRLNDRFVDADAITRRLRRIPGVTDVRLLVLGRAGATAIEDLYAVVERDAALAEPALERCLAGLPATVPRPRVLWCPRVPRNVLGKLDRDSLIAWVREEVGSGN
ncbi:AMP-binding protein [Streptomyces sp. DSM 44915]|uniref:AMP-binding protein n=1 Tax=Streptomyces chisholmiae TaxID=3075540 RepID=A0ABU2JTD6_9ACTN|nr:AMP-binding protein [Streptomyces sp. DSM 44915]MDT0267443.1 AMP-binding protein [Streptomyces sp. DSM 44915]